jgi:hypothetical protein
MGIPRARLLGGRLEDNPVGAGRAAQLPPRLMSAFELQDAEKFIEATAIAGSTAMR